jgi:hypothetical protein
LVGLCITGLQGMMQAVWQSRSQAMVSIIRKVNSRLSLELILVWFCDVY